MAADHEDMRCTRTTAAGVSATRRFLSARRVWRRRVVGRTLRLLLAPIVLALVVELVWGTSSLDWALGFFIGAAVGVLYWVWDTPPAHVENWRRGAKGERRTARALRVLDRDGWHVRHDVLAEQGNRDHIVVGDSGVYLLDSKVLAGVVRVDGDVVTVHRPDDPRGSYRLDRMAPAVRAEAARLKADLGQTCRTWVQAVVVIWGEFPQRLVAGDRIVFVHGDELVAWLRERPATQPADRAAQLTDAVRELSAAA
jgi:hypothetical protein